MTKGAGGKQKGDIIVNLIRRPIVNIALFC